MACLVLLNSNLKILIALRVHIVGPDEDASLSGRGGKGTDAGHDIADHLARLKELHQPAVLRLELAVPVDLCVVEGKCASALGDLDIHVVRPRKDLVLECPVDVLCTDVVHFVDDCPYERVLVYQDLCY